MNMLKRKISVRKAADIPQLFVDSTLTSRRATHIDANAPEHGRFGALSFFRDEFLAPSKAMQPKQYAHVENVTYVVEGLLRHDDTLGNDFVLQHGDIERFSFGSGAGNMIRNNSTTVGLRLISIGIDARDATGTPSIEHLSLKRSADGMDQPLIDVASDDTRSARPAMSLHQRGRIAVGLPGGFRDLVKVGPDYGAYIYAISGMVEVGDVVIAEGDVATLTDAKAFTISGVDAAHAVVVVVPLLTFGAPSRRDAVAAQNA